jgi:hypothetical protein
VAALFDGLVAVEVEGAGEFGADDSEDGGGSDSELSSEGVAFRRLVVFFLGATVVAVKPLTVGITVNSGGSVDSGKPLTVEDR